MIWVSASGRVEAERLNLRLVCEHCLPENGILAATASQLLAASLRLTATKPRRTWEERIQYLVAALWETTVVECRSPEDAVCNVICDGCGLLTAATIREPPAGWHIGGLGESDYCPECRTEAT